MPLLVFFAKDLFSLSVVTVVALVKGDSLYSLYTDGPYITSEFDDACIALVIFKACCWCNYWEVCARNILPPGGWGKGILVYSAAVLVTCFREMSLTHSFVVQSDTLKTVPTSYPES